VDARTSIQNGSLWDRTGKSLKIYMCPTFSRKEVRGTVAPDGTKPLDAVRSYAMNSQLMEVEAHEMVNCSRILMFADVHTKSTEQVDGKRACERGLKDAAGSSGDLFKDRAAWDAVLTGTKSGVGPFPVEAVGGFHGAKLKGGSFSGGNGNAVFVDGHVESLRWSDTTNACSGNW
jgi:prepilin-type processing-associated H-X9-DG protein